MKTGGAGGGTKYDVAMEELQPSIIAVNAVFPAPC